MRLWIWSDLHLELQQVPLSYKAPEGVDAIVCAGDLCHAPDLARICKAIVEKYKLPMVFVPGNHEFYGKPHMKHRRTLPHDRILMQEAALASKDWEFPLYVLDDGTVEVDGVRFVGGTLWTDFLMDGDDFDLPWRLREAPGQIGDFSNIFMQNSDLLSSTDWIDMHRETAGFIREELKKPFQGKTVVVTHHLPYPGCTPEFYRGSSSNHLFASSEAAFGDILRSQNAPALWICGHTHEVVDVTIGKTRVVCNPFGYRFIPHERGNGFSWDFVIDTEELR